MKSLDLQCAVWRFVQLEKTVCRMVTLGAGEFGKKLFNGQCPRQEHW